MSGSRIHFVTDKAMRGYGKTTVRMTGFTFAFPGPVNPPANRIPGKVILFGAGAGPGLSDGYPAKVTPGAGSVTIDSDPTGPRK